MWERVIFGSASLCGKPASTLKWYRPIYQFRTVPPHPSAWAIPGSKGPALGSTDLTTPARSLSQTSPFSESQLPAGQAIKQLKEACHVLFSLHTSALNVKISTG